MPENLSFQQIRPGADLKEFGRFAAIVSWSVFEHVDIALYPSIINNFSEVLTPDVVVFTQIEPLWCSSFGSHLQSFVDEPWAHLLYDREKVKSIAFLKQQPEDLNLPMGNTQSFDQARLYRLDEFDKLNHVRASELIRMFNEGGFHLIKEEWNKVQLEPPASLLGRFSRNDLVTERDSCPNEFKIE